MAEPPSISYVLGMRRDPANWGDGFPFDVPAVAAVERLRLDEPEAALSVTGELALLAIVVRAARAGAQFVIATRSPILLACPDAQIYELDDAGLAPCAYDDLDAVRLIRGFLEAPGRFIRAALEDPEGDS